MSLLGQVDLQDIPKFGVSLVIKDGFETGVFSSGDVPLKLKHWQGMTRMAIKEHQEIAMNNKNGDELIVNCRNNDETMGK